MDTVLSHGKPVKLRISAAARSRLAGRSTPLLAELELYVSCQPITTAGRTMVGAGDEVPTTATPVVNHATFGPHWLAIDYRRGAWVGEFGYQRAD